MITPSIATGFVLGALLSVARAQPDFETIRALRLGQWRTAAESLRAGLEETPDDPELLSRLGLAYYQLGLFSDAEAAFRNAAGSVYYESQGIGAHATTLRELGKHDEAATLRQGQIIAADSEAALSSALLGAADDAIAAGDLHRALELAEQALALRPSSPNTHAWLADIHLRLGDDDQASFHLWLAELDGFRSNRTTKVLVTWALEDDALVEALNVVADGRQGRRRNAELAVYHARILRRLGWLDEAQEVFEHQFVHFGERRDYLVERGQLLIALDARDQGCQSLARAAALYPDHSEARAVSEQAGCDGEKQP